jgi:hypothetical protein
MAIRGWAACVFAHGETIEEVFTTETQRHREEKAAADQQYGLSVVTRDEYEFQCVGADLAEFACLGVLCASVSPW